VPEWGGGRTTLETIVQELQRPVCFDETFERRVMVRVRRLHAERRSRGWVAIASRITHRPGWAAALAASVVAVVTLGLVRGRTETSVRAGISTEPVQFVLVAPEAHSVAVVGDFNDWGLNDGALVATNHEGVWSVTAPVPAGVHRYAFLVNGKQWVADPSAPRATDDDFGMPSSALVVEDSTR
jgi:hypothetical protein